MHYDLQERKPKKVKKPRLSREDAMLILERRIRENRCYLAEVEAEAKKERDAGRHTLAQCCELRAQIFEVTIETLSTELDTMRRSQ